MNLKNDSLVLLGALIGGLLGYVVFKASGRKRITCREGLLVG